MKRGLFLVIVLLAAAVAQAFPSVPKESAKALGVTKGKPFTEGLVFVNGKFVPPPYVVERWGTGIRINKIPVTGQIILWNEFLKTQEGVSEAVGEASAEASRVVFVERMLGSSDGDSLDDLFEDDGTEDEQPVAAPEPASDDAGPKAKPEKAPPKPRPQMVLKGAFVKNEATRALVAKINAQRAEIDRTLRGGGFICFGDRYARISGDRAAMARLLSALPEIQMKSETLAEFCGAVRAASLHYLHELVCGELFANRIDYRALQEYRAKLRKDREWQKMMEGRQPLF